MVELDDQGEPWDLAQLDAAVEVIRREVFAYSSIWGEEIVRYAFIYLAWTGAAAAVRERAHIRIDVILLAPGSFPRHTANAWQP